MSVGLLVNHKTWGLGKVIQMLGMSRFQAAVKTDGALARRATVTRGSVCGT